jgi:hypothetical protein
LEAEDLRQDGIKQAVGAVSVSAILKVTVVAVFIATTEALSKVVVIIAPVHVVSVVPIVRILVGIRVSEIGTPAILAICFSGPVALFITIINGLAEKIRSVLIRLVVAAASPVTIFWNRVEIRITIVVGVPVVPKK